MTDISTIEAQDREVELRHPANDEGLGWFFSLRSPYSEEVRKADRKWQNKRLAQMGRRRGNSLTVESLEVAAEAKIEAAVSGWRFEGDATFEGEQPEFSVTKLREIVRNPKHRWIRDFLDTELGDYDSFFNS